MERYGTTPGKQAHFGLENYGITPGKQAQYGRENASTTSGQQPRYGVGDSGTTVGQQPRHGVGDSGTAAGQQPRYEAGDYSTTAGQQPRYGVRDSSATSGQQPRYGVRDSSATSGQPAHYGAGDYSTTAGQQPRYGAGDYGTTPGQQAHYEHEETAEHATGTMIASPAPLGLCILAFATALLGCFYAGFIVPFELVAARPVIGTALIVSGIVLILAGMWEFRKGYMITATSFTAYGGFLLAIGMIFGSAIGALGALAAPGALALTLGLIFLCWLILNAVLFVGALRTNASMVLTIGLLFCSFLLLTIGQFALSRPLLIIGGWIAIVTAIVAWLSALASILSSEVGHAGGFKLPLGQRIAAVE